MRCEKALPITTADSTCLLERIGRDQNRWCGEMVPKLKVFYTEGVVAELFTRRIQRGKKLHT